MKFFSKSINAFSLILGLAIIASAPVAAKARLTTDKIIETLNNHGMQDYAKQCKGKSVKQCTTLLQKWSNDPSDPNPNLINRILAQAKAENH